MLFLATGVTKMWLLFHPTTKSTSRETGDRSYFVVVDIKNSIQTPKAQNLLLVKRPPKRIVPIRTGENRVKISRLSIHSVRRGNNNLWLSLVGSIRPTGSAFARHPHVTVWAWRPALLWSGQASAAAGSVRAGPSPFPTDAQVGLSRLCAENNPAGRSVVVVVVCGSIMVNED